MKYLNAHFKMVEEKLGFPKEAVELFEEIAQKIEKSKSFSKRFDAALEKYMTPKAHDFGGMCDDMKKLAFCYRVKEYSLTIVWLIVASEKVLELYKEKGIDEKIYWDSMMDLKYKFKECVDCKEVYGTFVGHWYTGFYELNRFALGRFQFEYSTFGAKDEFVTSAGVTIKKGDKTVGFHIPSSGVPLTDDIRLDAYKKAYEFFKDQRREDGLLIFECGSWLLYEGNREILPEKSNTIKFLNDFEIIESNPKDKFTDAWRVFGKYGYKSAKYWPEDSSMRKAFKTHVLNGGKTGSGHGVIVFDGEKIVR